MGWFGRKSAAERALDRALEENRALVQRLDRTEARAEAAAQPQPSADAMPALVSAFGSMAKAVTDAMTTQAEMSNRMLERTYRREVSSVAAQMGLKGREVRKQKEAAAAAAQQLVIPQLDLQKVKECEECAAEIEGRSPRHANNLMRHKQERHEALVLPLCHANGSGN